MPRLNNLRVRAANAFSKMRMLEARVAAARDTPNEDAVVERLAPLLKAARTAFETARDQANAAAGREVAR